ncbi:hypothetical protein BDW62DRAFT_198886 [Aspergillus aurantiobrunneus]
MQSLRQKIYRDIDRLHEQEDQIKNITVARDLGIKIRRVEQPASARRPVPFKPCFFLPPKDRKRKSSRLCAKRASSADSSASPSSSVLPTHESPSQSSSTSLSLRRSSFFSSRSSTVSDTGQEKNEKDDVAHPPILVALAELKGLTLQRLHKDQQTVLTAKGPVTKGKTRYDESLELEQLHRWKVTEVLEDTTYVHPHAIIELCVNPQARTDAFFLTVSEVKAMVRVMKLRMKMNQYQEHVCLPVLALSYIAGKPGGEYESGRIIQAHHDGQQLMIQYSQRLDFSSEQMAPASLDKFLRYYFCEPVKTRIFGERECDKDPWDLSQSWNAMKKRCGIDLSDADDDCWDIEGKEDTSMRRWLNKFLA